MIAEGVGRLIGRLLAGWYALDSDWKGVAIGALVVIAVLLGIGVP